MALLSELNEAEPVKMLVIGDSGGGKTGSLASLVKAGYRLHILDFDNGTAILGKLLDKESQSRVEIEKFQDKMKATPTGLVVDGMPKAFVGSLKTLTEWTGKYKDKKDIIVIDSFSFLSNAAMRYTLAQAGRPNGPAQLQDWGIAQNYLTNVLSLLYSSDITCSVLILAHIKYLEADGGLKQAQVNTLGSALPPTVGRYFNNMVWVGMYGGKRVIKTKASPTMALKTSAPGLVKDQYELETGMAEIFKALEG